MARIPDAVQTLLAGFSKDFAPSVWQRFLSLLTAAVMVRGRRTVWRLIRWSGDRSSGHFSSYHRVFSHRRWSSLSPAKRLAAAVVERFAAEGIPELAGDDTVSQHRGEHVYGKGCHRDAVRSSHQHLVHRWGHKWVVLALRVQVTGATRTWALPMLVALLSDSGRKPQSGRYP